MKRIGRGFCYEIEKLIHDKTRIVMLILSLCLVAGVFIALSFLWMGFTSSAPGQFNSNPIVWDEETIASWTAQRDADYNAWLVDTGQVQPTGTIVKGDPINDWKSYSFDCFFLTQRPTRILYEGYSPDYWLFNDDCVYQGFPGLSSSRLFFFQDLLFMAGPCLIFSTIHAVFLEDEATGFDKNLQTLGIKKKDFRWGKLFFSLCFVVGLGLTLSLFGFVFFTTDKMAIYANGEWHQSPVFLVYYERWFEIVFVWLAFASFDFFLTVFKRSFVFYPIAFLGSLALFPSYSFINNALSNKVSQPEIRNYPFWNVISSDGFTDGFFFQRMFWPCLAVAVLILLFFGVNQLKKLIHKRRLAHKKKSFARIA
jgi:hypothetical protein